MGCTSSNYGKTDPVTSLPQQRSQPVPHRRTASQTCGGLFCLSSASVDVPEHTTTRTRRIQVQNNGSAARNIGITSLPPARPRGRVFEICDIPPERPMCNGKSPSNFKPRGLPKIPELAEDPNVESVGRGRSRRRTQKIQRTRIERFSDPDSMEESPRESSVPKLPPLFTPRQVEEEDNKVDDISWETLLGDKDSKHKAPPSRSRGDPPDWLPPRPESRTEITRDINLTRTPREPRSQKTRVLWEASYDCMGRLSNICDVAFLRPDCIAVSQDSTEKTGLQLYDVNKAGLPGNAIGEPDICTPRGICLDRDGHVVVTDAHSQTVKFMDTYGMYLASWKHGKFRLPAGIAQTREGQFVVSDERGGDKAIGIYSGRGTVIRKFGMPWFDCPWYIAVDNYNRVLVSEQSVSGVIVFDNHGRFLFKFGSLGGGEAQLNFQSGIAIDSKNQVLVADSDNYRVCLYSADGYFIENIVTHLPSRPVSLALYEAQSLLAIVTDSTVYMHKMDHTYSHNSARFQ